MTEIFAAYDRFDNRRPMGNLYSDDIIDSSEGHGVRRPFSNHSSLAHPRYDAKIISVEQALNSSVPFVYEVNPTGPLCSMIDPRVLPYWQNFPSSVIDAIQRGQAVLLLNGSWEGDDERVFDPLHTLLRALKIPLARTLAVTGNHLMPMLYNARSGERLNVVVEDIFISEMSRIFEREGDYIDPKEALSAIDRDAHFLSFNRVPRPHRLLFASQMVRLGLDQMGLLSMPSNDDIAYESIPAWPLVSEYWPRLREDIDYLKRVTPLTVDRNDFRKNHFDTSARGFYLQSYFSIVTETLFAGTAGRVKFVSEKIYKPLGSLHPFLLIGAPGLLSYLRSLGFRTFGETGFVNEDYDEITCDAQRMRAVLNEVRRLCRTPLSIIREHYLAMMPILIHNQALLRSYAINERPETNTVRKRLVEMLYGPTPA